MFNWSAQTREFLIDPMQLESSLLRYIESLPTTIHTLCNRTAISPECLHQRHPSHPPTTCLHTLTTVPGSSEHLPQYICRTLYHTARSPSARVLQHNGRQGHGFLHSSGSQKQSSPVLLTVSTVHCSIVQWKPSQRWVPTSVFSTATPPVLPNSVLRSIGRHPYATLVAGNIKEDGEPPICTRCFSQ